MEMTVIGKSKDAKKLAYFLDCKLNNYNAEIGIRYGSINMGYFPVVFNPDDAVWRASNKYKSLKIFKEAQLSVPNFSTCSTCLKYPMLGRKFHHSKGRDIKIIRNGDELRKVQCNYYIEFIPIKDEYRAHVVCDEVVSIAIKCGGDINAYCRNLKTGWIFKESTWRWKKDCLEMPQIAIKAIKALGLDFGAVDIIISKQNKPYILEVNTAPGLIDRRAKIYAEILRAYIH